MDKYFDGEVQPKTPEILKSFINHLFIHFFSPSIYVLQRLFLTATCSYDKLTSTKTYGTKWHSQLTLENTVLRFLCEYYVNI